MTETTAQHEADVVRDGDGGRPTSPIGRVRDVGTGRTEPHPRPARTAQRRTTALLVHVASLVLAGVYLALSARGAQFYRDDWTFLARLSGEGVSWSWLLEPHNEHWTLLPKLEFAAMYHLVGIGSPWAWVLVTVATHLVLCHLLWRFSVQHGADPLLATIGCAGFAVFAAGVENIMWAFQTGLVGNLVLGVATLIELSRPRPRWPVVVVLSVLNLMTSGIAVIFGAISLLMVLLDRRFRLVWALVPMALGGAAWYLLVAPAVTAPPDGERDLTLIPLYWVLGIGNAVQSVVPWRTPLRAVFPGLSATSALLSFAGAGLLLVVLLLQERFHRRPARPVMLLFLGCPLFVLVTSVSRIEYGVDTAMLSRYCYVSTAFLLPFLLCSATALGATGRRARMAVVGVAGALAVANAVLWWPVAGQWSSWAVTNARIMAAGQEIVQSGAPIDDRVTTYPEFSFLTPSQLRSLATLDPPGEPTAADRLSASLALQVSFAPDPAVDVECGPGVDRLDLALDATPIVSLDDPTGVEMVLLDADGSRSHVRGMPLEGGVHVLRSLVPGRSLELRTANGVPDLRTCTLK